jgi:hypothetical protein
MRLTRTEIFSKGNLDVRVEHYNAYWKCTPTLLVSTILLLMPIRKIEIWNSQGLTVRTVHNILTVSVTMSNRQYSDAS